MKEIIKRKRRVFRYEIEERSEAKLIIGRKGKM